jgi:hypothetical protein
MPHSELSSDNGIEMEGCAEFGLLKVWVRDIRPEPAAENAEPPRVPVLERFCEIFLEKKNPRKSFLAGILLTKL